MSQIQIALLSLKRCFQNNSFSWGRQIMGTALFSVALGLVITKNFYYHYTSASQSCNTGLWRKQSPKVVYDGSKIYFSLLMSNFKRLCMFVLMRTLMHSGCFHFSQYHMYQGNLGEVGCCEYFPSRPTLNRSSFAKC